jgi:Domain of unknown function (DUF4349)
MTGTRSAREARAMARAQGGKARAMARAQAGKARACARAVAGGVVLVAALGVAGCVSGSRDAGSSASAQANQPAAGGVGNPADSKPSQGTDVQAKQPTKVVPDDRAIVYTGSVTVRVSNVDTAASAAATLAGGAGGYLSGDQRTRDDRRSQAQLVLRVPAARFGSVVDALGRLGTEEGRSISTQDVTDQVVDFDARIATGQAGVDRVRALLARAQTISEITALESEVSRREADLESLKARQRKLSGLTELSTITAVLLGPDADKTQPATGFLAGLRNGWRAFLTSSQALLTGVGAALPFLVALAIPIAVLVIVLRRARRRTGSPVPRDAEPESRS